MLNYILLLFSDMMLALNFTVTKMYQKRTGVSLALGLKFNALLGVFSAVIFFAVNGFKCDFNLFSVVMAFIMAACCIGYTVVGFHIMQEEKMALYTVFLMTGGMSVPYVWGLIFLGEEISVLRTLGLIVVAAAVFVVNAGSKNINKKQLLRCLSVFFFNGFVSVVSKEHQINSNAVSAQNFVILTSIAKTLLCIPALLFAGMKNSKPSHIGADSLLFVFFAAVLSGISYFLQLRGAAHLPATVLYPFVTGGSIVFTAFAGKIFFKEILNRRMIAGIILCFLGTSMFL